jgi:hypothetical protein
MKKKFFFKFRFKTLLGKIEEKKTSRIPEGMIKITSEFFLSQLFSQLLLISHGK